LQVINSKVEQITGYKEDELFGRNTTLLLPEAERAETAKRFEEVKGHMLSILYSCTA
jgi:PAS domain S-box-containing protein